MLFIPSRISTSSQLDWNIIICKISNLFFPFPPFEQHLSSFHNFIFHYHHTWLITMIIFHLSSHVINFSLTWRDTNCYQPHFKMIIQYNILQHIILFRTRDPKFVGSNPVRARVLCPWARHFTLACSSQPRCTKSVLALGWEGNRLVVRRTSDPLTATFFSSLAQSLVKRRWAPLDALKSIPTQLTLPILLCRPAHILLVFHFYTLVC